MKNHFLNLVIHLKKNKLKNIIVDKLFLLLSDLFEENFFRFLDSNNFDFKITIKEDFCIKFIERNSSKKEYIIIVKDRNANIEKKDLVLKIENLEKNNNKIKYFRVTTYCVNNRTYFEFLF